MDTRGAPASSAGAAAAEQWGVAAGTADAAGGFPGPAGPAGAAKAFQQTATATGPAGATETVGVVSAGSARAAVPE